MGKPDVDEVEIAGAIDGILQHCSNVIGKEQARSIAYYALIGARAAKVRQEGGGAGARP